MDNTCLKCKGKGIKEIRTENKSYFVACWYCTRCFRCNKIGHTVQFCTIQK